jgi:hypothetical protein
MIARVTIARASASITGSANHLSFVLVALINDRDTGNEASF